MIGIISGIYAVIKIYRIRRKNRIDTFYTDALKIRDSVADCTDYAMRNQAAKKLKALQDTAFQLLIDEKLSADESFRIFITMSNDIIDDLTTTPAT